MSIEKMHAMNGATCACGKVHSFSADVVVGKGVIAQLPNFVRKFQAKKPFVVSDVNTYPAAGEQVCRILSDSGIAYRSYSFTSASLEPDEHSVGSVMMH